MSKSKLNGKDAKHEGPVQLGIIPQGSGLDRKQIFDMLEILSRSGKQMLTNALAHEILMSDRYELLREASPFSVLPLVGIKPAGTALGEYIGTFKMQWPVKPEWQMMSDYAMVSFDRNMHLEQFGEGYRVHAEAELVPFSSRSGMKSSGPLEGYRSTETRSWLDFPKRAAFPDRRGTISIFGDRREKFGAVILPKDITSLRGMELTAKRVNVQDYIKVEEPDPWSRF